MLIEQRTAAFYAATFALCLAGVVVFSNLHLIQPLLPALSRQFNLTPLQTSWSYTISTLCLGLSLLVYASLSDAWGRKKILLLTLSGMTLSTLALTQVDSFQSLLFWRAVQGFCMGGLPAVAIAYMGEEYTKPALLVAVGYYISANSIGGISGRLIAGWLADLGHWQWVFWPMTLLSALSCYMVWRFLPSSTQFKPQPFRLKQALLDSGYHLRQPLLWLTYLIGGLNFFIFLNQYTYISFVLADAPYHLSSSWIGLLFVTYFTGTIGSALSGNIGIRLSPALGIALGIVIMMLGTLVTLSQQLEFIVTGFFISAFGFFLCHSLASSWVNHNATKAKASASALYLVFYYLGASTGSLYLQPFWQWQNWTGVVIASLLIYTATLFCSLVLWRLAKTKS